MKFLLSDIDQAPLDRILTYFKVQRRESSDDKKDKFSQATFRKKVEEYCADNGFVCLPPVCLSSETERSKKYMRVKAWVKTVYFDDENIWGPGKKKLIRELRQSETCLFFVKSETEAGALTAEDVNRLRKEYYSKPDSDPCIDPETGEPYVLTEDERLEWEIYMLKKQGNYVKANKLYNEKFGAAVAAEALPAKQQSKKTGEVKDEELPF